MPLKIKSSTGGKGLTLIEILIAIFLFAILATVASQMLITSLHNYSNAQVVREIRYQTHSAFQTMVTDINRGIILPSIGTATTWVPSAILSPNPYGATNGDFDPGNGITENYLAISVSSGSIREPFLTGNLSNYQVIKYVVPDSNPNELHRIVYYNISTQPSGYRGFSLTPAQRWLINDPQLSMNQVLRSDILISLPDLTDKVSFKITRPEMTMSEKKGNPYGLNYSPNVLNIKIETFRPAVGERKPVVFYSEQTNARTMTRL
jgi:prepilin-type N-terminal cleavage/methylation domain-containing protein